MGELRIYVYNKPKIYGAKHIFSKLEFFDYLKSHDLNCIKKDAKLETKHFSSCLSCNFTSDSWVLFNTCSNSCVSTSKIAPISYDYIISSLDLWLPKEGRVEALIC